MKKTLLFFITITISIFNICCLQTKKKIDNLEKLIYTAKKSDIKTVKKLFGNGALCAAAAHGNLDIVEILLKDPKNNVNAIIDGSTALHNSIIYSTSSMIELLLSAPNIDLNIKDANGRTALTLAKMLARNKPQDDTDVINLKLIEKAMKNEKISIVSH